VKKAGFEAIGMETEVFANTRAIIAAEAGHATSMIVDLGSEYTSMAITQNEDIGFIQSASIGGKALTRAIAKDLGLGEAQAEEYKKTYGLNAEALDGKVAKVLSPILETLITEIKKAIAYFNSQSQGQEVQRLVLTGGGAILSGLVLALTEAIGLEVQVVNPFHQVKLTENQSKLIGGNGAVFTTAVGLARKRT
jgi:type IV pilus assembly protein PilM